jgi:predicted unusual protein kinase regulating ubiquinone biosynthesis (AarF/ABC1/UbiB family)
MPEDNNRISREHDILPLQKRLTTAADIWPNNSLFIGSVQDIEEAWNKRGGIRVYNMMLDLSGYYVKSAQIIASKGDYIPM